MTDQPHDPTNPGYADPSTINDTFAFIIHPINPKRDVSRKWPWLGKLLTEGQVNFFSAFFPPVPVPSGTEVGWRQAPSANRKPPRRRKP